MMRRAKIKFLKLIASGAIALTTLFAANPSNTGGPLVLQVHPFLPAAEIIERFNLQGVNKRATGLAPLGDGDYDNLRTILRGLTKPGVEP